MLVPQGPKWAASVLPGAFGNTGQRTAPFAGPVQCARFLGRGCYPANGCADTLQTIHPQSDTFSPPGTTNWITAQLRGKRHHWLGGRNQQRSLFNGPDRHGRGFVG